LSYNRGVSSPESSQDRVTDFLLASKNSVTRERLLFHRLCFDLYASAVRAGYPLTVFSPEVDREGYDLVLDDGDNERRVQLKSILSVSSTKKWNTTKRFLRPELRSAGWLDFEVSPEGVGVGGGIVLIECDSKATNLSVTYHFTDLMILAALAEGWVPGKAPSRASRPENAARTPGEQAQDLLIELRTGSGHDELEIPIGVFVAAAGPDELLELVGLHSSVNSSLRHMITLRIGREYERSTHGPIENEISCQFGRLIRVRP
jgi:hypothetical protein